MISKKKYFAQTYQRLTTALPSKPWRQAFAKINKNPKKPASVKTLSDHIMAYGLNLWETGYLQDMNEYELGAISEAMYYGDKFLELWESVEAEKRSALKSKYNAAFTQPSEMRSINFEVFMYHFMKSLDYEVECKDDVAAGQTYDFLVTKDQVEVQVECKSFAYDKGLHLTGEDAMDLASRVLARGPKLNTNPAGEVIILTIEMHESIPKSLSGKESLVDEVYASLDGHTEKKSDKFKLHLEQFNGVKNIHEIDGWLDLKFESHGSEIATVASMPNKDASRICLKVTSRAKNSFWRDFEAICKDAAKRQLKADKPASIVVHISHLQTLDEILDDDRFKTKRDNIFHQQHIVSLTIVANTGVYEERDYPYFYLSPKIIEFTNSETMFPDVGRIFSE